jgi:serine/threonine protein kinase
VKPGNVLLDAEGRACLTDFGIATSAGDETLTEHGVLVGSPSYMSPERARGEEAGPFADLWSLGATLYTAVEGRGPFDRGEAMATLLAVTTEPPTQPERAGALTPVLLGLLQKEPEQRMPGWAARDALRSLVDEASRPLSPHAAPSPEATPPPTVAAPSTPPPSSPPPAAPPPTQAPPAGPPPPPARPPDSLARLHRDDIAKLAGIAGRSFAKGAAKAAVAGLSAWQEKATRSGAAPNAQQPPASPPHAQPARARRAPAPRPARSRRAPAPRPAGPPRRRRHPMRLPLLVVGLVASGLVIGVALLIVLIVLALG